jgi:hypothetical protein
LWFGRAGRLAGARRELVLALIGEAPASDYVDCR